MIATPRRVQKRIGHSEKPKAESKPKDRTRIHRGEPGCHEMISLVNGEPMIQTGCPQGIGISDPTIRANRVCDPLSPEQEDGRECVASTVPTPDHIQDKSSTPEIRWANVLRRPSGIYRRP